MLRMIIWVDPDQKEVIFKKSIEDIKNSRKNHLEDQVVELDPKLLYNFINLALIVSNKSFNNQPHVDL